MSTPQPTAVFRDPGEIAWPHRLHVCCGGIYLRGYRNVDIAGALRSEVGSLFVSDPQNYFAGLDGDRDNLPTPRPTVCDVRADMRDVDAYSWGPGGADKILCVQALEHVCRADAMDLLLRWSLALRPGGVLIVSVPDLDAILQEAADASKHQFLQRHLFGSHHNPWQVHRYNWTRATLGDALRAAGYRVWWSLDNPHFHPSIVVRAER
jgi:SAM-dependent methyltransferase